MTERIETAKCTWALEERSALTDVHHHSGRPATPWVTCRMVARP
jgi:hypothetical protein